MLKLKNNFKFELNSDLCYTIRMIFFSVKNYFRKLSDSLIRSRHSLKGKSKKDSYLKNSIILIFFINIITFFLISFSLIEFINKDYMNGIFNIAGSLLLFAFKIYLIKYKNFAITVRLIISFCLLFAFFLFQTNDIRSGAFLWTLTTPLFLIFFLKLKEGVMLAFSYLAINIGINLLHVFHTNYTLEFLVRYSGVYATVVVLSYIYGKVQEGITRDLLKVNFTLNKTVKKLTGTKRDLEKSEEQYKSLVENSSEGIGILRNFHFIFVNSKLCNMSGYSREEILEKELKDLIIVNNQKLFQKLFDGETWTGLPRSRVELTLRTKNGENIEVEIGTNTVEYKKATSQLIFIRDLTERKMIEKEKTKISNMESFQIVANGVTHDFNNLLTIIMGNLELMRMNIGGNVKLETPIKKIENASERVSKLLNALSLFSSNVIGSKRVENIAEIIGSLLIQLKEEFPKISFKQKLPENLWKLKCDRNRICIALKNILLNAVDATESGSQIVISVDNILNHIKIVQPLGERAYLKISITDSGKGIPEKNINRVFDPYFSTKGDTTDKGIGLGLAIANKIIVDHNGLISIESKEKKGTTFNIFLPAES